MNSSKKFEYIFFRRKFLNALFELGIDVALTKKGVSNYSKIHIKILIQTIFSSIFL